MSEPWVLGPFLSGAPKGVCACEGSGWFFLGFQVVAGRVEWVGWAACGDCNPGGMSPKPRVVPMSLHDRNGAPDVRAP